MEDDLQYVVRQLQDCNLKAVSKQVKLSYPTVQRIARGLIAEPKFGTVKKLKDYFDEKARK